MRASNCLIGLALLLVPAACDSKMSADLSEDGNAPVVQSSAPSKPLTSAQTLPVPKGAPQSWQTAKAEFSGSYNLVEGSNTGTLRFAQSGRQARATLIDGAGHEMSMLFDLAGGDVLMIPGGETVLGKIYIRMPGQDVTAALRRPYRADATATLIGNDVVSDQDCENWRIDLANKDSYTVCMTVDGINMRTTLVNGQTELLLTGLTRGPQDTTLFVPPADARETDARELGLAPNAKFGQNPAGAN